MSTLFYLEMPGKDLLVEVVLRSIGRPGERKWGSWIRPVRRKQLEILPSFRGPGGTTDLPGTVAGNFHTITRFSCDRKRERTTKK